MRPIMRSAFIGLVAAGMAGMVLLKIEPPTDYGVCLWDRRRDWLCGSYASAKERIR